MAGGGLTLTGGITLNAASDLDIDDNTASALTISEGSNNYLLITTTNDAEVFTLDLPTGGATSQTANLFTSNIAKTINLGTGTAADTINIGTNATNANSISIGTGAVANTIAIGSASSTTVSITDDHWSVTAAGAATFVSVNAATGAGTFDSLSVGGGYGSTGVSISNAGNIEANGTLTVDSTTTLTGAATLAGGIIFNNATDLDIDDNTASSLTISEGSNNYFLVTTTNSSENISFGNATTNPTFSFLGTGLITVAGAGAETASLTLTTGTVTLTDGDLTISSGEIAATSDDATGTAFSFTGVSTTGTVLGVTANSLSTGTGLDITSTSTAGGASGTSKLLNLSRSGANSNTAHTAYGIYSSVTNTNATSGTNIAGYFTASGATTANYAAIFDAGNVGIGTTAPTAHLEVGGTTFSGTDRLAITGTQTSSSTGQINIFRNQSTLDLTGASVSTVYGLINLPIIDSSSNDPNISTAVGAFSRVDTNAGYAGTISTGTSFQAGAPSLSGTNKISSYYGFLASAISNTGTSNSGNTSGTVNNINFRAQSHTAEAGVGGTLNNYGVYISVPNGSGTAGTTNNYGLLIDTNSTAGDSNYSIYNSSTANSYFAGNVGIGDTSPDYLLELHDATNTPAFVLSDDDIAHGLTTLAQTDVFWHESSLSTTAGGAQLTAISDTDAQALSIRGVMGSTNPTDATPAIKIIGAKSDGATGMADLAATETVFQVANNDDTAALTILGSGNVGIGDSTPSSLLEVGNGTDSLQISSVGDITFVDADGAASITGPAGGALTMAAGASQALTLTANAASTWSTSTGNLTITSTDAAVNVNLGGGAGDDFNVDSGVFVVESDNNRVGIGTASPGNTLSVSGAADISTLAIGTTTAVGNVLDVRTAGTGLARFTNTATSSSSGGAGMVGYHDGGAAIKDGDRLGFFLLGGAKDASSTLANTAGFVASAAENWTSSTTATDLSFQVNPSGQLFRNTAIYIKGSNSFIGLNGITAPTNDLSFGGTANRKVWLERNTTSATAGKNLTIEAGGATVQGSISALNSVPTAGGTGYTVGDTLTITTGGTGGTARVVTVDGNGAVLTVTLTAGGSGYTTGTGKATSGGTGDGLCTLNITTVRSSTDKAGGNLVLSSGVSTGTGTSQMQFWTNPAAASGSADNAATQKMVILGDGNVGIGTTSPDSLLTLKGSTDANTVLNFGDYATTNTLSGVIQFARTGTGSSSCGTAGGEAQGLVFKNDAGTQIGHFCADTAGIEAFGESWNASKTDLAENYSDIDNSLEPGDLVIFDERNQAPKAAKKSELSYSRLLMGVVSTDPGFLLSNVAEADGSTDLINPKPIALTGRVPTKVSLENGPVEIGDPLTSSSVPGIAMKATRPGLIVGRALEPLNAVDANGYKKIEVFVNLGYQQIDIALDDASNAIVYEKNIDMNGFSILNVQTVDAALVKTSQLCLGETCVDEQTLKALLEKNELESSLPVIETNTANALPVDTIQANNGLIIQGPLVLNGGLRVDSISAIGDLLAFESDVIFFGRPYFNTDTAGFALIAAGDQSVDVVFEKEYLDQPIVNATVTFEALSCHSERSEESTSSGSNPSATPQDDTSCDQSDLAQVEALVFDQDIRYIVTNKSETGFSIKLNKPAPTNLKFSWTAFAVKNAKVFSSKDNAPITPIEPTSTIESISEESSPEPEVAGENTESNQDPAAPSEELTPSQEENVAQDENITSQEPVAAPEPEAVEPPTEPPAESSAEPAPGA